MSSRHLNHWRLFFEHGESLSNFFWYSICWQLPEMDLWMFMIPQLMWLAHDIQNWNVCTYACGMSFCHQTCTICSQRHGACIHCAHKNCRTSFHTMCGFRAGYHMEAWPTYTDLNFESCFCVCNDPIVFCSLLLLEEDRFSNYCISSQLHLPGLEGISDKMLPLNFCRCVQ
jgi:hypothetical protein